jgi:hypothetical protein
MLGKLLGLLPIIHADGPDVARSAMARAVAEGIWLPTALLPRYGVVWRARTDEHIVAEIPIGGELVTLQVTIDSDCLVRSDRLDRWNDPDGTGTFGWSPFGVEAAASHALPCGITMPAHGIGGWLLDLRANAGLRLSGSATGEATKDARRRRPSSSRGCPGRRDRCRRPGPQSRSTSPAPGCARSFPSCASSPT